MRYCIPLVAAAAVFAGDPAYAEASSSSNISVVVPEVCQIESSTITVDASGQSASGTVFEMCNSGRGFRVIASHRPLGSGEEVEINYGGEIRQLDGSGISNLAYRHGPIVGDVPVTLQSSGLAESFSVSIGFTII